MNKFSLICTILFTILIGTENLKAQAMTDTVNGWYYWGTEDGQLDTTYSVVHDTSIEGKKSQLFGYSTNLLGPNVYWEKEFSTYPLPETLSVWSRLNKLTPEGLGIIAIYVWVFVHGDSIFQIRPWDWDSSYIGQWKNYRVGLRKDLPFSNSHFNKLRIKFILAGFYLANKPSAEFLFDKLELIYKDTVIILDRFGDPTVGVKTSEQETPIDFKLEQNYPNPFNGETKISYSLPKNAFVILEVFDLLGKKVATLVNEKKSPGNFETVFETKNLPSGIYFYRLSAENFIRTKKLVLLK